MNKIKVASELLKIAKSLVSFRVSSHKVSFKVGNKVNIFIFADVPTPTQTYMINFAENNAINTLKKDVAEMKKVGIETENKVEDLKGISKYNCKQLMVGPITLIEPDTYLDDRTPTIDHMLKTLNYD